MSTALYRRYRPDTFEDVIGQEHVTAPLITALGKDAVSHAYLFSGPRGCGKTTSARILARCLNCAQGPTGAPCGHCESCVELATGGPGSLDVIEIDAASHGGVDDARDLRERATFAPVRDRYKIFIIDEAHMVTAAGFNALLKIVEEPPEHIKFIFATTEPDKVIGTIRSRTHHYPFRLVPPEPLLEYLQKLCTQENVNVAHGVLPLVIRAGGGSVRDTLSVLDQLIAGSTEAGLDYDRAVALLGFTHAALLDDVVDSVAALDGATAFNVVDRVVQSGQDPRRFVEDLLERLRDLIIVKSVPQNPGAILRGVPEDQIRRMQDQAAKVGAAELSRAADITAVALTEMVGATSPRLHLELLMARLLLPSAEEGTASLAARLERLERRVDFVSGAGVTQAEPEPQPPQPQPLASQPSEPQSSRSQATRPQSPRPPSPEPQESWQSPQQQELREQEPVQQDSGQQGPAQQEPVQRVPREQSDSLAAAGPADGAALGPAPGREVPPAHPSPGAPEPSETPVTTEAHEPTPAAGLPGGQESSSQAAAPSEPSAGIAEPSPGGAEPSTDAAEPSADDWAVPGVERSAAQPAQPAQQPPQEPQSASQPPQRPQSPPEEAQRPAAPQTPPSADPGVGSPGGTKVEMMRRAWPDVIEALASKSRLLWMLVKDNTTVAGFDGQTLTLAFSNDGARATFANRQGDQALNSAIQQVLGMQVRFDLITGGAPPAAGSGPKGPARPADGPGAAPAQATPAPSQEQTGEPFRVSEPAGRPGTGSAAHPRSEPDTAAWADEDWDAPPPETPAAHQPGGPASPTGSPRPESTGWPSWSETVSSGAVQPPADTSQSPAPTGTEQEPAENEPGAERTADMPSASTDGGTPAQYVPAEEKPPVPVFARKSSASSPIEAQPSGSTFEGTDGRPAPPPQQAKPIRRYERLMQQVQEERGAAGPPATVVPPPQDQSINGYAPPPEEEIEDIPSEDDIAVEESSVFGRKAFERLLDATLIEERRMGEE